MKSVVAYRSLRIFYIKMMEHKAAAKLIDYFECTYRHLCYSLSGLSIYIKNLAMDA